MKQSLLSRLLIKATKNKWLPLLLYPKSFYYLNRCSFWRSIFLWRSYFVYFCYSILSLICRFWIYNSLQERTRAYADTLGHSYDNLRRVLQLIDYTAGYYFLSVRDELRPIFHEALQAANIDIGYEYKNLFYYLPKEKALQFHTQYAHWIHIIFKPIDLILN